MPFVVVGTDRLVTSDNRIFATIVAANARVTALNVDGVTEFTAITTEAPDTIEPGWSVSSDGTSFQKGAFLTDAQQKAAYKTLARAHAEECLDLLPAWWGREGKDGVNKRWEASYYHIVYGAAIVAAATDDATYTVAQLGQLYAAYQSLVPASKGDLHDWHFEADVVGAGWSQYTTAIADGLPSEGRLRAYLKVNKGTLATAPAFKSDSQASQAWDGNNNTIDVTIALDATPLDVTS